ncbi:MAG: hypothetical protein GXY36_07505 [Chloroflexi bacterium]|nr:hypothetical protein [Chloroflexota bacterium]
MGNIYRNIGAVVKDTGGLWERLDNQMSQQAAPAEQAGFGIWGMIVTETANGIWDQFDNETVYLRHEHLESEQQKPDLWREAADETLILPKEGLLALWDAVLAKTDATGGLDVEGTIMMLREDADSVWQRSQEETLIMSRPTESIFAQQVRTRDLTTFRPRRAQGYALKKLTDARGETYWILKNLRTDAYLRLTAEQVFLWNQMDGEASVQDIAVAYMMEYGKLAITGLLVLLDQLQQKGFIEPLVDIYGAVNQSVAQRRANVLWRRALRAFMNTEFAIGGIDGLITRSYHQIGRLLFAPVVQWIILAVIAAGGVVFLGMLLGIIERDLSVLGVAGTSAIIGLVSLYVLQFITLLIHEWSHAIATKHYGREVRRGGFLLYMGMPAAFVDTTDIWMEPRQPRIVVSWAGPHSGFFLGGLASLLILAGPGGFLSGVLYQFAFLTYLTSFMNLNPLLKLDGYYILMDWLEIPRLREKSMAFVGRPLWRKLRTREKFSREERIFAVFGVLSAFWTLIALGLALKMLGGYVISFAQTVPGMIVLGLLAVLLIYRWGSRRMRRRLAARRKQAAAQGA